MTLQELYASIEGDYERALSVLRVDRLIDKHVRRLPDSPIFNDLREAGAKMDPVGIFESSHAIKGVCFNLGLIRLGELASEISEEFRPSSERKLSDEEVAAKIGEIDALYQKTRNGIRLYENTLE